ncbi:MAG TPA: trypsin-like peptidase domain-containing protein [Bacillota bacterium]|nr:trypsin-like peptidase domain-containing protein [Bacillota bacterium]
MENDELKEELSDRNLNADEKLNAEASGEYRTESGWKDFTPHTGGGRDERAAAPGISAPPPMKKKKYGRKVLAVVLILVLAAGAGFGGGMAALYFGGGLIGQPSAGNITIKPDDKVNTAEAIAAKVLPSVVGISTSTEVTYQSIFGLQKGVQSGVGTGIIVDEKGYILTNSHVISDGTAEQITVQLTDGREVTGSVLWNDKSIDLAIVKIDAPNLTAAELGDSETVKIGAYAAAIGNPLGMAFDRSVTQGVISGLNRSITVTDGQSQITMDGLIQTDASINSGNSGGPLLNSAGQVIGINSAKAQSAEGLGFAIPINTAKPIVDEIKSKGEFKRSYIGIKGASVADYLQEYPDGKLGTDTGVYVVQIYTDSPAAKAGLKEGDVITGLEGKKIETMTQLISSLFQYRPGDEVKLSVLRNGREMTLKVTLTTMDEAANLPESQQVPQ